MELGTEPKRVLQTFCGSIDVYLPGVDDDTVAEAVLGGAVGDDDDGDDPNDDDGNVGLDVLDVTRVEDNGTGVDDCDPTEAFSNKHNIRTH